jgi:hypothetical protein
VEWCISEDMPADLLTKNVGAPLLKRHTAVFCGEDDYVEVEGSLSEHFNSNIIRTLS